jgi:hypothetical protein
VLGWTQSQVCVLKGCSETTALRVFHVTAGNQP